MTEKLSSKTQSSGETRRTFLDRFRKLGETVALGSLAGALAGWKIEEGTPEIPPELAQYLESSGALTPEEQKTILCERLQARYQIHYGNFISEKRNEYLSRPELHLIGVIDLAKTKLEVTGFSANPSTILFEIRNTKTPLGPDEPAVIPFQMVVDATTRALSEEMRFRKVLEKALEPFLVQSPA